jgi:L,D-peptidoglycan transpeptidase YkuD (ErfK/YbiS/YcfS/YnhG family)
MTFTNPSIFKTTIIAMLLVLAACNQGTEQALPLLQKLDSQQVVVVISDDWDASTAKLQKFSWEGNQWRAVGNAFDVNIGRTGLAWGLGLHDKQSGYYKQEGDGKATAGVFDLTQSFGYLDHLATAMPYSPMSAGDYCIDVNGSEYYNQIVDEKVVGTEVVKDSTEPMRRDTHKDNQDIYKKGLVVDHNLANKSGQGSCIFLHIWFGPGVPTAGCTAMAEPNMDELLVWLDPQKNPRYVALPRAEYMAKQQAWGLPAL